MQAEDEREQQVKTEYHPPRLVRIGSIADVTRVESPGPGPFGAPPVNGSGLDAETLGRIVAAQD